MSKVLDAYMKKESEQIEQQHQKLSQGSGFSSSPVDKMVHGMQANPLLAILIFLAIVGAILSIGPMLKAKKIGKVACNKCGHIGKLKQTMTNKLVCSNCGSGDWKLADKEAE